MSLRRWVGLAALVTVGLKLPSVVVTLPGMFGVRVSFPAWASSWLALLIAGYVLEVFVRLGSWRLAMRSPAAWTLLLSAVGAVLNALLLALPAGFVIGSPVLIYTLNWAGKLGALLFAVGVLVSGLSARWVGWTGVFSALLVVFISGPVVSLANRVGLGPAAWLLAATSLVLGIVFLVAFGVGLLSAASASNKRIERTP